MVIIIIDILNYIVLVFMLMIYDVWRCIAKLYN